MGLYQDTARSYSKTFHDHDDNCCSSTSHFPDGNPILKFCSLKFCILESCNLEKVPF
ncbi:hypothetical protein SERLADRAFT_393007 [Serpula lacrymans var. lacrymans S7.9]|uniref:Uncharacterized protein n=1 Tax=Serpula lacrymans var. lacrymans (strain S7.9) TaxID=578457 RepID=F8P035_SERL9|nr:uncharacterized protein SERLADRAFT_393007 [Serpula lacrymans var. lacrymans S7.9]EGO24102.1 hypothetical protein SERLADRAFT_393007 [Serpula lacrymans var. lacrymans S7.9]